MANQDLISLSTVSSTFQHPAEAVLYATIDLNHWSYHLLPVLSWCRTVGSVPRKAHCVRALRFPATFFNVSPRRTTDEIEQLIKAAFDSMINLKHLSFSEINHNFPGTVGLSTLADCRFRLSSLTGDTPRLHGARMESFLSAQPEIEYWSPSQNFLNSYSSTTPFPETILPRLRKAVIQDTTKLFLIGGRPIEYLLVTSTGYVENSDRLMGLKSFAETLHNFYYIHESVKDWSVAEFIACVAENAPRLVSLTVHERFHSRQITRIPRKDQDKLLDAIARLPRLETLVLSSYMDILSDSAPGSANEIMPSGTGSTSGGQESELGMLQGRRVAGTFMAACRSLVKLSFPVISERSWVTFLRCNMDDEGAIFDGFYMPDTVGWWKGHATRVRFT
ncbi:hypothetical protein H0H81_012615 [Sphagnurus paluster]|uniref:Uncharacterized protein n=1 Tax=Sphagnurus paluster TaxID=117069 RepID=A0A9P7FPQ9_9AGAR|nr:hypothetical protein H0H81_012615 [Sphagnurus paluster]